MPPDALQGGELRIRHPRIKTTAPQDAEWWRTFNDPKLSELVRIAQQQNPTVQTAGRAGPAGARNWAPRSAICIRKSSRCTAR